MKTLDIIEPPFLFVENPKTLAALRQLADGKLPKHVILLSGAGEGAWL